MSKADAAEFLRQLAHSSPGDSSQPRVIVVKASRELKAFVARALETLETVSHGLKHSRSMASLPSASRPLEQVEARAAVLGLLQISDSFRYAASYAAAYDRADPLTRARQKPTLASTLKYLSAGLLRVYVDGHDDHCGTELALVRRLVSDTASMHTPSQPHAPEHELLN